MKRTVGICRYLLLRAEDVCRGLDDTHRSLEPAAGASTAGWLLGHLTVTGDYARQLCGRAALCPADWTARFAPGSRPATSLDDYPPMTLLRDTFAAVYADLCDAAPRAGAERLAEPNPYAAARPDFPTRGDFVAYLMTAHLAYHLGQLAGWRAAAGLGRVPRGDGLAA